MRNTYIYINLKILIYNVCCDDKEEEDDDDGNKKTTFFDCNLYLYLKNRFVSRYHRLRRFDRLIL